MAKDSTHEGGACMPSMIVFFRVGDGAHVFIIKGNLLMFVLLIVIVVYLNIEREEREERSGRLTRMGENRST